MKVTGETRIYRKDFDGRPAYSRSIASREFVDGQRTDNWIRTYESVKLPRDCNLQNRSLIDVTNGFESVFKTRSGEVKRQLVIMDYKLLESGDDAKAPDGFMAMDEDIPF